MNKDSQDNFELSETIIKTLGLLKTSPAFAMSRGGRELFHTNFLAFILEQTTTKSNEEEYSQRIKRNLLSQIFSEKYLPINVKVFREKLNLDLIIIPIDDIPVLSDDPNAENLSACTKEKQLQIVVIEAKLKSIPTVQQLVTYSKKLEKVVTIDLYEGDDNSKLIIDIKKSTLTIKNTEKIPYKNISYDCFLLAPKAFALPDLAQESKSEYNWSNLNWNNIFQNLDTVQNSFNEDSNQKINIFIEDYIESTNNVLKLISQVIEFTDSFINTESKLSTLYKFSTHDSFKRLKLHDLVGKVAYEFLAKKIYESLPQKEQNLHFKAFLSNSTPGFEIEFSHSDSDKKQEIGVGVQLQGSDYRHYIKRNFTNADKPLIEIANTYAKWLFDDGNNEGKGIGKSEYKKFDINKFLYLSRTVNLNFKELCKVFKHSLAGASCISQDAIFTKQLNKNLK